MKILRVPWIRCRADELGAVEVEMTWKGRDFVLMAYSEKEGKDWWSDLTDSERSEALGLVTATPTDEMSLF